MYQKCHWRWRNIAFRDTTFCRSGKYTTDCGDLISLAMGLASYQINCNGAICNPANLLAYLQSHRLLYASNQAINYELLRQIPRVSYIGTFSSSDNV